MLFDIKKVSGGIYFPGLNPEIVSVPEMKYVAFRGCGCPDSECGDFRTAINALYDLVNSAKAGGRIGQWMEGYSDFVVPPLETFWWHDSGVETMHTGEFGWIVCMRMPDFVTRKVYDTMMDELAVMTGKDFPGVEFMTIEEGLCVQCLHAGPLDEEPVTIARMGKYLLDNGYCFDLSDFRLHHEICLSDGAGIPDDKMVTIIRIPIRKAL